MQKMNIITVLIYFYLEIITTTTTTNIITNSVFDLKTEVYRKKKLEYSQLSDWLLKRRLLKLGVTRARQMHQDLVKKIKNNINLFFLKVFLVCV